jgi:hypothetical protein
MDALRRPREVQRQKLLVAELDELLLPLLMEYDFLADRTTITSVLETENKLQPVFHPCIITQEEPSSPFAHVIHQIQKLIGKDPYVEMNDELSTRIGITLGCATAHG